MLVGRVGERTQARGVNGAVVGMSGVAAEKSGEEGENKPRIRARRG